MPGSMYSAVYGMILAFATAAITYKSDARDGAPRVK
jgi:hypothetical protein